MINTNYEESKEVKEMTDENIQAYLILNEIAGSMSPFDFEDKFLKLLINLGVKPYNIIFYVPTFEKVYNRTLFEWYELNVGHMLVNSCFRVTDVCVGGTPHNMIVIIKIDWCLRR